MAGSSTNVLVSIFHACFVYFFKIQLYRFYHSIFLRICALLDKSISKVPLRYDSKRKMSLGSKYIESDKILSFSSLVF